MVFGFTACGSSPSEEPKQTIEVPKEVQEVRDAAMKAAQDTAKELEGYWVDRVANLVLYYYDDSVKNVYEYTALKADLEAHAETTGAAAIAVLVPNEEGTFRLTVDTADGSWLKEMKENPVYKEAYVSGLIASERSGYKSDAGYFWTAYSPLYNQAGELYAILAVDYPADVLKDFTEWDRTSESWNQFDNTDTEE